MVYSFPDVVNINILWYNSTDK